MKPEPKWLKIACVAAYFVSLPMVIVPICLGPFLFMFEDGHALAGKLLVTLFSGAVLGYAPFILIALLRREWRAEPERLPQTSSRSGGGELQTYRGSGIPR